MLQKSISGRKRGQRAIIVDESPILDALTAMDDSKSTPDGETDAIPEVVCENFDREDETFEAGNVPRADLDATRMYLKEIEVAPLLTAEEEVRYSRMVQRGEEAGRRKMIVCNLRLVVKIARRYMYRGMALLDLIEEGNLGLMRAVEKFDPERGFRFSTYAIWWIRQNIERAIMNQTRSIRLPVHVIKELNVYLRAQRKLSQELDHEPTAEDVAHLVDRPVSEVRRMFALSERVTSVDMPIGREGESPLIEFIPDTQASGLDMLMQDDDVVSHVEEWLGELEDRQCEVIVRRFGLRGHECSTLEKVGSDLGVTRERVRQIQMEGLKRLRGVLERRGFSSEALLH